jgi:hypothetical protein
LVREDRRHRRQRPSTERHHHRSSISRQKRQKPAVSESSHSAEPPGRVSDGPVTDTGCVRPLAPPRCSTWADQGEAGRTVEPRIFCPEVSAVVEGSTGGVATTSGADCRMAAKAGQETLMDQGQERLRV